MHAIYGEERAFKASDQTRHYWFAPSQQTRTYGRVVLTHGQGGSHVSRPLFEALIDTLSQGGWQVLSLPTPHFTGAINSTAAGAPDPVQRPLSNQDQGAKNTQGSPLEKSVTPEPSSSTTPADNTGFYKYFLSLLAQVADLEHGNGEVKPQKLYYVAQGRSGFWLSQMLSKGELNASGFIAVSIYYPEDEPNRSIAQYLSGSAPYTLDIFASKDNIWVLDQVHRRNAINLKRKPLYRQVELIAADHRYRNQETLLAQTINAWLHFSVRHEQEQR